MDQHYRHTIIPSMTLIAPHVKLGRVFGAQALGLDTCRFLLQSAFGNIRAIIDRCGPIEGRLSS